MQDGENRTLALRVPCAVQMAARPRWARSNALVRRIERHHIRGHCLLLPSSLEGQIVRFPSRYLRGIFIPMGLSRGARSCRAAATDAYTPTLTRFCWAAVRGFR